MDDFVEAVACASREDILQILSTLCKENDKNMKQRIMHMLTETEARRRLPEEPSSDMTTNKGIHAEEAAHECLDGIINQLPIWSREAARRTLENKPCRCASLDILGKENAQDFWFMAGSQANLQMPDPTRGPSLAASSRLEKREKEGSLLGEGESKPDNDVDDVCMNDYSMDLPGNLPISPPTRQNEPASVGLLDEPVSFGASPEAFDRCVWTPPREMLEFQLDQMLEQGRTNPYLEEKLAPEVQQLMENIEEKSKFVDHRLGTKETSATNNNEAVGSPVFDLNHGYELSLVRLKYERLTERLNQLLQYREESHDPDDDIAAQIERLQNEIEKIEMTMDQQQLSPKPRTTAGSASTANPSLALATTYEFLNRELIDLLKARDERPHLGFLFKARIWKLHVQIEQTVDALSQQQMQRGLPQNINSSSAGTSAIDLFLKTPSKLI
ncbi:hypothetical protein BJ170DRAFT_593386 [Xylariales sp. AK1849]|nr:hypothetical protein BJ170DRAFT_593386 [Xylariales sp. AK1849]